MFEHDNDEATNDGSACLAINDDGWRHSYNGADLTHTHTYPAYDNCSAPLRASPSVVLSLSLSLSGNVRQTVRNLSSLIG